MKPGNIYVCRYGRDVDFVKVLDFGLVKLPTRGEDVTLTADHAAGGTPAFMAPEQVLGDRPVDGRSDLYAVGCLAYWLLTGELVFFGETAMKTMLMHAQAEPAAPSTRTELPIPAELDRVVLRCLAKHPGNRPQTAVELATALHAIDVTEPWSEDAAHRWWALHRPSSK